MSLTPEQLSELKTLHGQVEDLSFVRNLILFTFWSALTIGAAVGAGTLALLQWATS